MTDEHGDARGTVDVECPEGEKELRILIVYGSDQARFYMPIGTALDLHHTLSRALRLLRDGR